MKATSAPRPKMSEQLSVGSLLWGYRHVPRLMHLIRPTMVSMTWRLAGAWRDALRINGRIILGSEVSDERIDQYGLGVLLNMQRYMEGLVVASRSTEEDLLARIQSYQGIEQFKEVRRRHRGAVLISMHMGEFEPAAALIRRFDAPMHILYRRDHISRLERVRDLARKRLGVTAHAVDDGLVAWAGLRDALDRNEVVAVHGDRVQPGQKGIRVELMGRMTQIPVGPFKLAHASGAPLVPVFNRHLPSGKLALEIGEPLEIDDRVVRSPEESSTVKAWIEMLTMHIRANPEQWLNVHRVWESEDSISAEDEKK